MLFTDTIIWLVALTALVLWPVQNAQHEGMHAFMAKRYGAVITKMVLWPTDADDKFSVAFWRKGHTWAYVQWSGGDWSEHRRAAVSIAPQATNTLVLLVLLGVRVALEFTAPIEWVFSILAGWALVNFIDGAVNLSTFYKSEPERKSTDGWSFQEHAGLNKWLCRVGAGVWHLGFGAAILLPW
jgi:hypothetical protein